MTDQAAALATSVDPAAPCACHSGLTAGRCCAFDPLPARVDAKPDPTEPDPTEPDPTEPDPTEPDPTEAAAAEALRAGDPALAARLAIEVLEAAPLRPHALATLAEVRLGQRRARAARALLERLIKIQPVNFWPINKLALLELGRGDAHAAEPLARRGIRIAPENAQAHNLLAMTMTELGRSVVGEYHCRKALELLGTRPALVLANLATNLFNQGRIAAARTLYREADGVEPDNRKTLLAWARMEEADRNFPGAHALLDRLDRLVPDDSAVGLTRAMTLGRDKRYDEAIAVLEGAAKRRARDLRPVELLERGRLRDRLGLYEEAWADFDAGKARARELSGHVYQAEAARGLADRVRAFFRRGTLQRGAAEDAVGEEVRHGRDHDVERVADHVQQRSLRKHQADQDATASPC